jgi:4-oxalocrotonate tautomerase
MPHIIVKLWPGKSEQQKERLAEKIAKDVMDVLNYGEESVSVDSKKLTRKTGKKKSTNRISRTSGTSPTRSPDTRCEVSTDSMKGRIEQ